jgi:hypothetical protein
MERQRDGQKQEWRYAQPQNVFRLELFVFFITAFKEGHMVNELTYGTVHNNKKNKQINVHN